MNLLLMNRPNEIKAFDVLCQGLPQSRGIGRRRARDQLKAFATERGLDIIAWYVDNEKSRLQERTSRSVVPRSQRIFRWD
jgi:hypothetical protein